MSNADASDDAPDPVRQVFDHWHSVMGKNGSTKLTPGRRSKIKSRLKAGYTPEFICTAIDACKRSPHHMGHNDGGTYYNDLTLICRSDEKLEWFANTVAVNQPSQNGKPPDPGHQQQAYDPGQQGFTDMYNEESFS